MAEFQSAVLELFALLLANKYTKHREIDTLIHKSHKHTHGQRFFSTELAFHGVTVKSSSIVIKSEQTHHGAWR